MFLWHSPSARAARPLAGTLSGGVRTFLPSPRERENRRPSGPLAPRCYPAGAATRQPASSPAITCRSSGGSSTTQRARCATPSTS